MIKTGNYIQKDYKQLIKEIGQEKIMSYYLKLPINLNRLFISPLRKDNNPTAGFYYTPYGNLRFNDFGVMENLGVMDVIMKLHDTDFRGAILTLQKDIEKIKQHEASEVQKEDVTLYYAEGKLEDNLTYWKQYNIGLELLHKYNVTHISKVYRNDKLYLRSTQGNPVYMYRFNSGRLKFYRPLTEDKKKKWYGDSNGDDVGGFEQLNPTGSICFITSSLKDVMVLRTLGFNAVCLNGEGYGLGEPKTMNNLIANLRRRFRFVMFYMNNDDAGLKFSSKLNWTYRIPYITNPENTPKDISDYLVRFKHHLTFRMLKKIIRTKIKSYAEFI